MVRITHGIGDIQRVEAGEGDDVARLGLGHLDALQAMEAHDLQHAPGADIAIAVHDLDRGVGADLAALDAADADDAHEGVVVEAGDLQLEGALGVHLGGRHMLHDGLKQRGHVAPAHLGIQACVTVQGGGIDHREVELRLGRTQAVEQVEHLVDDPVRAGAGAIHLVHHHDRLEAVAEGLLGHEAGLRHGAIHRIDDQQHGVHHRQHALDLAAEVGMPWGIDDIDAEVLAFRAGPANGGVLRQNGNAALLLDLVGVHHALADLLALTEGAGLFQELVDQRGLAMIDVGDNGDIAKVLNHKRVSRGRKSTCKTPLPIGHGEYIEAADYTGEG